MQDSHNHAYKQIQASHCSHPLIIYCYSLIFHEDLQEKVKVFSPFLANMDSLIQYLTGKCYVNNMLRDNAG